MNGKVTHKIVTEMERHRL